MNLKVIGDGGNKDLNRVLYIPDGSYVEDGEELDSIVCRAPGKQPIVHYFTKDGLYDGWAVQADPGMTDEECKQEVEQIEALQVKW